MEKRITILNSVCPTLVYHVGFVCVEHEVALRTLVAECVWKVFRLNVVPHIAQVIGGKG